jgi:hypothetical protein
MTTFGLVGLVSTGTLMKKEERRKLNALKDSITKSLQ